MKNKFFKLVAVALIFAAVAVAGSADAAMFTRFLTVGSTGADVVELQTILETQGYLVMPAGVAKGYFGQLTKSAVAKWQAAVGLPSTGYFGPLSIAKINAGMTGGGSTGTPGCSAGATYNSMTGERCDSGTPDDDDDDDVTGGLRGGETSLEDYDASSGDDSEVEEDGTADIFDFEFDVEDADAEVDRIDVSFQAATTEEDPWDTFETVTLLMDGEEIADMDASDEDEWSEDEDEIGTGSIDDYSLRFSNIDEIVREGDTAQFTVRVTAQRTVDDLPATWTIGIGDEGIRVTDGEGIDSYTGQNTDTVTFDVEEAGEGEELTISEADDNPEANTLQIDEDTSSDWYEILAFDIEAEESDIEITELPLTLTFNSGEDYGDVINDIKLEVDGEEFDDVTIGDETITVATTTFEFDNEELVIDADSTVTARLWVKFNSNDTIDNGDTVTASITSANVDAIEAEGEDDLAAGDLNGSVDGNTFTLRSSGIAVMEGSSAPKVTVTSQDAADGGDYGTYIIKFEVTAFEEDAWVPLTATAAAGSGADFHVTGTGASSTATTTGNLEVESGTTVTNNRARVSQGQTREFTLTVVINPASDGFYGLELENVNFATSSTAATSTYEVPDEDEFEVDDTFISAN